MQVGYKSDKGKKRCNNEDACYVMPQKNLYIVADGVGGSNAGEVASRLAVTETANYFLDNQTDNFASDDDVREFFEKCVEHVNEVICEKSKITSENKGMATTLIIAFAYKNNMYIANIGDSRAYLCNEGTITQVTEDHTYVNGLVKAGLISKKEAEHHEDKNMITRAVGTGEGVEADMFKVEIKTGDILLICTDGLYGEVDDRTIIQILEQDKEMSDVAKDLVNQANENGGRDNITVVCIKIMEEDIDE